MNKDPSKEQLQSLLELYQKGQFKEAENHAIFYTNKFPKHQFAWKVLGAVLKQTGRNAEALRVNKISVELSPQDADAHYNLGMTLQDLGKLEEAEASYRKAIGLQPDYSQAYNNLGITLKQLGKSEKALETYKQAIKLKPDYADAHYNLGVTLQELGKAEEAEASYRKAVALQPDYVKAYNNLGIILKELGNLEEAEDSYRKAIKLKPDYADAYTNLGNLFQEIGRLDEALEKHRQAIAFKPEYAEAHYNLGLTLRELGNLEEAEDSYRKAIKLKPDYADAYLNLCELLEQTNKLDEVLFVIKNAKTKIVTKGADFLFYEALVQFRQEAYEVAKRLITKININELTEKRKSRFLKLKADWYHHQKEFNIAFETYKAMNDVVKKSPEYKKQRANEYFNENKEKVFQLKLLQGKSSYTPSFKSIGLRPTFLVGFPRSGTTLLDTILRSHSKIDVVEEQPMLSSMKNSLGHLPNISMIEKIDYSSAKIASNFYFKELKKHTVLDKNQIVIDKLPLNILHLPLINKIFPKARFILALRHPFDCVMSCWMQNFRMNPAMANMVDLDRIIDFYCLAMEILNLSQKRYSLNIHKIRYEDLIIDFEVEVSKILSFLNLKWEDKLRNYQETAIARGWVNTPSYSQVLKPIYKTASYRWKNYEEHLESFKSKLLPWIDEYKY